MNARPGATVRGRVQTTQDFDFRAYLKKLQREVSKDITPNDTDASKAARVRGPGSAGPSRTSQTLEDLQTRMNARGERLPSQPERRVKSASSQVGIDKCPSVSTVCPSVSSAPLNLGRNVYLHPNISRGSKPSSDQPKEMLRNDVNVRLQKYLDGGGQNMRPTRQGKGPATVRDITSYLQKSVKKKHHKQVKKKDPMETTREITYMWMDKTAKKRASGELLKGKTAYMKLKRTALAVKNIIHVCRVCKELVMKAVANEAWFDALRSLNVRASKTLTTKDPTMRPFVAYGRDHEGVLTPVVFDRSDFNRETKAQSLLTSSRRERDLLKSESRTTEEVNEILVFLKRAIPAFLRYDLNSQKKLIEVMWYSKFERDRVIYREGQTADFVYFVLTGNLAERTSLMKGFKDILPGYTFGESEIACNAPRKHTIVTTSAYTELLCIHKLDYKVIVNMADDSCNPIYLNVCRNDPVLQHFTIKRLIQNPGTWTMLSYAYGRAIAKNSNDTDWIFVVKSGEVKVLRYLNLREINIWQRRKILERTKRENDRFYQRKKIIDFSLGPFADIKSKIRQTTSPAPTESHLLSGKQRRVQSAPLPSQQGKRRPASTMLGRERPPASTVLAREWDRIELQSKAAESNSVVSKQNESNKGITWADGTAEGEEEEEVKQGEKHHGKSLPGQVSDKGSNSPRTGSTDTVRSKRIREETIEEEMEEDKKKGDDHKSKPDEKFETDTLTAAAKHAKRLQRPKTASCPKPSAKLAPTTGNKSTRPKTAIPRRDSIDPTESQVKVPHFVQLEVLSSGQVFGLRSCLDKSEQGPAASLVSAGCEVIQINKKFFMNYYDETIASLIRASHKAYPSDEDLFDRMDNNFQWEEYKHSVLEDVLIKNGRIPFGSKITMDIELPASS